MGSRTEANKRQKLVEMRSIYDSFEWLLKEKLISMYNITRAMQTEMSTFGVKQEDAAEYIPQQFARLWREVQQEQAERYDAKGGKAHDRTERDGSGGV